MAGIGSTAYLPVGLAGSSIELRWADKGLNDARLYTLDATNFLADQNDTILGSTVSIAASPDTLTFGPVAATATTLTWLISGGTLTNPAADYMVSVQFSTALGQVIETNIWLRVWPLSPNKTFSTDLIVIQGPPGPPGSQGPVGTVPGAVSCKSFGAIGDGTSHPLSETFSTLAAAQAAFPTVPTLTLADEMDWVACSAAVAEVRTVIPVANAALLLLGGGRLVFNRPLDLTGFSCFGLKIDGQGTSIVGNFNGIGAILDFTGSSYMHVEDIFIQSGTGYTPMLGLTVGRHGPQLQSHASSNTWIKITVNGNYSFAAFYDFASEQNTFVQCTFGNGGGSYIAGYLDGMNHGGFSSIYAPNTNRPRH